MNKISALISAGALAISVASAGTATYSFSFDNVDGTVGGTVSGTFELADGDGSFAPTSFIVDTAPAALGYSLALDFLDPGNGFSNLISNTFTVAGGLITNATFGATNATEGILIDATGTFGFSLMNIIGTANITTGVLDNDSTTLSFDRVSAVPLPASMPLLLAGLGAVTIARRRKKAA